MADGPLDSYRDFQPLLLEEASADLLASDEYAAFVRSASIVPAIRLFLHRHEQRPDWGYLDTKFNPNTGRDRDASYYGLLWGWFLGRAMEGMDGHLAALDELVELSDAERDRVRELFPRLIANSADAVHRSRDVNNGRVPFRMNLQFQAVDADGRPIELDGSRRGDSDLFCAKGLMAEGSPQNLAAGVKLLGECVESIRANIFVDEPVDEPKDRISHGARMLIQDIPQLLVRKTGDAATRETVFGWAAEALAFVLDHHYDPQTHLFSETVDATTFEHGDLLDPGHANELVGLGLSAVAAIEADGETLDESRRALLARAKRDLPRLLARAFELGFNATHGGIAKAVNNRTGEPINADMPWWNLPETMRAAARAAVVADAEGLRLRCLEIYRLCHNAYFANYLNREMMLFPFQTRCGRTGRVLDVVPAVPEGDPLYHTNLSLLEALQVIREL